MPQVIPAIAAWVANALVTAGVSAFTAAWVGNAILASGSFFVTLGLSLASAALAGKPKALTVVDPGAQLRFSANPSGVRSFVYGETAVAGQVIFQGTTGDNNKFLHIIAALGDGGEYESIQSVEFDNETLTLDGSGFITSPSKWAGKGRIQTNLGSETQEAFPAAVSEILEWTSAHAGKGVSLAYIRLEYDPEVWQGVPQPLFITRGRKVYDTRLDTSPGADPDNLTYWAWTQNPVLWALDYLRSIKTNNIRVGGMGVPNDLIDWDSWDLAADVCDEPVNILGGGTIPRYTNGGGVISSSDDPLSVMEAFTTSFSGVITTRSGKVACYAGEVQTATVTLTDDDLSGPVKVSTNVSIRDTANAVSSQYREPSIGYEQQSAPPYRNSTWEAEDDNEILWTELVLPFVDDHRVAQRLAKIHGGDRREPRSIACQMKIKAIQILEGEVFNFDSDSYGSGVNGKYRLVQKTINPDSTVDIVARSETDFKYSWDETTEERAAPTGTITTSSAPTPDTPTGWTGVFRDIGGPQEGTTTVIDLTPPAIIPPSLIEVEIQVRRNEGPTLGLDLLGGQFDDSATGIPGDGSFVPITTMSVTQAADGFKVENIERSRNYSFRVRYVSGLGTRSAFQTFDVAVPAAGSSISVPVGWTASSSTLTSAEGHTRPVLAVIAPTAGIEVEAGVVAIDVRKVTDTEFTQQMVMTRSDAGRGVNLEAEPGVDYIVRVRYGATNDNWGPGQQIPVSASATSALVISGFGLASNSSASGGFSLPGFKVSWTALTGDNLQRARNLEIQYHVTADTADVVTIYAEPEETSKTVHGLLAGVEYTVKMRASDIFSTGAFTTPATITVSSTWTVGTASAVGWDDVTSRPVELTDGRIPAAINSSGHLRKGTKIAQDDDVPRSIPSGLSYTQVQDGDAVTFDVPFDSVPEIELQGGSGLSYATGGAFGSSVEQSQDFRILNASISGYDVSAKIRSTSTGTVARSDAIDTTGMGGDPVRIGQKGVADDSVNGTYSFEISGNVFFPSGGAIVQTVGVSVTVFIDTGSGFVERFSETYIIGSGAGGGNEAFDVSISVGSSITGQHGSEEWGYTVELVDSSESGLEIYAYQASTVDYDSASSPVETTATPDVQFLKAFVYAK